MLRTLFLQAPSFDGFDGGAGARYQTKREVRSFWYPAWLAQPAALVENSKLVDAPAHGLHLNDVLPLAKDYDLVVLHTSTPSFRSDVKTIEALKSVNPNLKAGMIGAKVAVDAEGSLAKAPTIDFVARNEFDYTIKDVADDVPLSAINGQIYSNGKGVIVHKKNREVLENMDSLPFVSPIYKRDLTIEKYFNGYLKHPYLSLHTGRGCKSRCTFCLWPQTVGGHRYRTRSVASVVEEIAWAKKNMPQIKEFTSSTTIPSPTICRAPKPSPRSWASSASSGRATPRPMCRANRSRSCATTVCACCWSVTNPVISRSCTM